MKHNGDGTFELTKDYDFEGVSADLFTVSDVDGEGNPGLVAWDETSVYVFPLKGND